MNQLAYVASVSAVALTLATSVAATEPIALFDGKSLDGWVDASGKPARSGWSVIDGELVCPGNVGSIYSAEEFENFDLSFRWKITAGGNSGVKYRVRHYKKALWGRPGWLGLEYQLADANAPSKHSTGALYELFAPAEYERLNGPGSYNNSRIVVRGDHIEHWLNGQKLLDVDQNSGRWNQHFQASKFAPVKGVFQRRRGRIMLQDHGSEVWFSKVVIKPHNSGHAARPAPGALIPLIANVPTRYPHKESPTPIAD